MYSAPRVVITFRLLSISRLASLSGIATARCSWARLAPQLNSLDLTTGWLTEPHENRFIKTLNTSLTAKRGRRDEAG